MTGMIYEGGSMPAPDISYTVKPHPRGGYLIGGGPLDCIKRARWDTARECVQHIGGCIYWLSLTIEVYAEDGSLYKTVTKPRLR